MHRVPFAAPPGGPIVRILGLWIERGAVLPGDEKSVVDHGTLAAPYPPLGVRAAEDEPEDE